MTDYKITSQFLGYQTKSDETNIDPRFLVSGSQNVLINDQEKIVTRNGFSLDGAAATSTNANISSFDWKTAKGGERNLRSNSTVLELRRNNSGTITYETLMSGLTSEVKMQFTTWYSSTETEELLLFVQNDSNIYEWSGGTTTFASSTAATITKQGSTTWAAEGFLTAGTRQIRVKDDGGTWRTFTYTGGETTTTLTGITPDPTTFTISAGNFIMQEVRTNSNQPASGLTNDFITTSRNQVYVGQSDRNLVYVSSNTSFTTYTSSSPRVPGEGASLTLDAPVVGFGKLGENVVVFCGKDFAYQVIFDLKSTSSSFIEQVRVVPLKIGAEQGAQSQDLITNIGDAIAYISNEPALRILTDIDPSGNPTLRNLSDPIKPDFDSETFTNGHLKFFRNQIIIATPTNGKMYILQFKENADGTKTSYWQPPQIIPVRQLADVGGSLYGHSSGGNESYKLFDGTSDNGLPMDAKAVRPYLSFGKRFTKKWFDEWAIEGYISANTTITHTIDYEFNGFLQSISKDINGANTSILYLSEQDVSLGNISLGDVSLSGDPSSTSNLTKFRYIHTTSKEPFFEIREIFESNNIDQSWQILATGPNVELSYYQPIEIKN